jgi:exodeoxyribonuclease VII large subunit
MIQVITRRWPRANIVVVPVPVQGAEAAPQIAAALKTVHLIPGVDVVICGRGGGSLEDLWAFNEEVVARAICACQVPVISAVGHEVDVTIADLVADKRALTPSEAAEFVVPVDVEIRQLLEQIRQRLTAALQYQAQTARHNVERIDRHPRFTRPLDQIRERESQVDALDERLQRAMQKRLEQGRQSLETLGATLNALSPLAIFERGYTLTKRVRDGKIIRDVETVSVGDRISTLVANGEIISEVVESSAPS